MFKWLKNKIWWYFHREDNWKAIQNIEEIDNNIDKEYDKMRAKNYTSVQGIESIGTLCDTRQNNKTVDVNNVDKVDSVGVYEYSTLYTHMLTDKDNLPYDFNKKERSEKK